MHLPAQVLLNNQLSGINRSFSAMSLASADSTLSLQGLGAAHQSPASAILSASTSNLLDEGLRSMPSMGMGRGSLSTGDLLALTSQAGAPSNAPGAGGMLGALRGVASTGALWPRSQQVRHCVFLCLFKNECFVEFHFCRNPV